MDSEDGMEQNGDKNDAGTASHYPVTTTWTSDFLTPEGEDRKAMGDWLHDKLIPWKPRRCLLQTNSETFPWETRLQKWDNHSDGICDLCKRCIDMGLGLLGVKPTRAPQVTYKTTCVDSKLQWSLEHTTNVSSKYRRT
jgi:hypothetical protein